MKQMVGYRFEKDIANLASSLVTSNDYELKLFIIDDIGYHLFRFSDFKPEVIYKTSPLQLITSSVKK